METTNIILIILSLLMPAFVAGLGILSFLIKSNVKLHEISWHKNSEDNNSRNSLPAIRVMSSEIMA